jgi:CRP-like cAMP-binding protein
MLGLRAHLTDVPLFAGLSPTELDGLFELCEVRELKASQVLFKEGDLSDALWVVLQGDVEVACESRLLAELGPGAVIGELSLFNARARRSATVTAICPGRVLRIPVHAFRKLITAGDLAALKVVSNVAHQMAERLTALNERLLSGKKGLSVARSELRRTVL